MAKLQLKQNVIFFPECNQYNFTEREWLSSCAASHK